MTANKIMIHHERKQYSALFFRLYTLFDAFITKSVDCHGAQTLEVKCLMLKHRRFCETVLVHSAV